MNWDGVLKHFNLSCVLPVSAGEQYVTSLHNSCTKLGSNPSRILVTEVLRPGEPRGRSGLFDEAIRNELKGLIDRGTYEIVCREEVPDNANILGGRFVFAIKEKGTAKEKLKAQFVVQGHTDAEKNLLIHNTTTLRQSSVRLLIAIAAICGFRLWSQDVTQAYLQSAEKRMRSVYMKPNKHDRGHFHMTEDQLLHLLRPLYGLNDAGDYWHSTFSSHMLTDLNMTACTGDLSLFFKHVGERLCGLTGIYVDDQIGTGDAQFDKESRATERKFQSKAREYDSFKFAGIQVERVVDQFLLHQSDYANS